MSDLISSDLSEDMKNSWGTDRRVSGAMDLEFNFDMDAAASHKNHLFPVYLTKEDNALEVDWSKITLHHETDITVKTVWVNPPYGRGMIKKFMQKCIEQKEKGVTSVMLVPATLDAQWLPINEISEIRIITGGRLTFISPCDYIIKGKNGKPDRLIKEGEPVSGNTKGSMFVIFRPSKMPCTVRLIDRDELVRDGAQ